MFSVRFHRLCVGIFLVIPFAAVIAFMAGCSGGDDWQSVNNRVMQEQNITPSKRSDIPDTGIKPSLPPGVPASMESLPAIELAPGVSAKIFWGRGVLVSWVTLDPGAEIPREELPAERIMIVWKGEVEQLVTGKYVPMRSFEKTTDWSSTPHRDCIYLKDGVMNAVRAKESGAEIVEIYWPVRLDYLARAGGGKPRAHLVGSYDVMPTLTAGKIMNVYDLQFTDIAGFALNSRIIQGGGMQIGFASTDPGFDTGYQCHPEERISICLRGSLDRTIMDTASASGPGDIVYLPGTMVHRDIAGAKGADCLDIYWPPRADIIARPTDRMAKYHAIIPADARPVLEHDGETVTPRLHFTEGPSWLNGCLYFSNMWFAPGFSSGDPGKSSLVRMCRDTIEIISSGMQTNGTMPLANGNLAVCDMFGHRLIEMNPNGGVVRTLATEYDGVRLDGPNDLVTDAKGGIYFTDPQFTPGLDKMQPGRAVYYRRPDGRVIRVVEPGGIGMPNGILLSPDGRTCYINNTRDLPVGNHLAAYDVNDDGTLSNMRMFGTLLVPPGAREQEAMIIGADGMTMDTDGRIYVATAMGLQILDSDGSFIGMVNFPIRPVSAVFGGDDMQTIYCTCATQIYSIRTNVKGLQYPLK